MILDLESKIMRKIRRTGECWDWNGALVLSAYPVYSGRSVRRYLYELHIESIPDKRVMVAVCDTKLCVNPDHLIPKPYTLPWEDRFWDKVDKNTGFVCEHNPELGECWFYNVGTDGGDLNNYGSVSYEGKSIGAHKFLYERMNGPVPDGLYVLHKCDQKRCIRPAHIYAGTPKENDRDSIERGLKVSGRQHWQNKYPERRLKGTKNGTSKLTDDTVKAIRLDYDVAEHKSQRAIARKYNISQTLVGKILRKELWSHID